MIYYLGLGFIMDHLNADWWWWTAFWGMLFIHIFVAWQRT